MSCGDSTGCPAPTSAISSELSPSPPSSTFLPQSSSSSPPSPSPSPVDFPTVSPVETTLVSSTRYDAPTGAPSSWPTTSVSASQYWAPRASSSTSRRLPGGEPQLSLDSLKECSPCGTTRCSFSPRGTPSTDLNLVVVGNPVANCQPGNDQVVTTKYLAAMEIEESWSIDLTLGLGVRGLNIGGSSGWSKSKAIKASQEVELIVVPGQMGALVANVSYKKTSGRMWMNSQSASLMSIQPQMVLNYAVQYADCGSQFKAFSVNTLNCSTGRSAGSVYATPIMPVFLALLSILWFMLWRTHLIGC